MNKMVTIPQEEYDRLREAAEALSDLHVYDRVKADLASGADERIPGEFAKRLIAGERPLRVYRDLRGLTQQALATASGVNRVQIADIEAGRSTGSVATLRKLADALGVGLDDLA
ncbi:MAG: transcriptional regulator [Alphaproteobacteria bacterium HGW-Alphaproteobacteria-13]|jgi:mRNA interferase RelE/StbE|nr:MAG: transcriptional regulator [Alphaproteobacteria bacterium HGW-Alphaproteobacteria-13]